MPCERTQSLQQTIVETPHLLKSQEWQSHLKNCPTCFKEVQSFDKSLELYLQLENTVANQLPEIQVWEKISQKVTARPQGFLQHHKFWTMAAAVVLLVGISLWWQTSLFNAPQQGDPSIPAHYPVAEMVMDEPVGPPSAETRFIWTKQQFGISIQNKEAGNYSKISIGTRLSQNYSQIPKIESTPLSSGLAYLSPEEKMPPLSAQ